MRLKMRFQTYIFCSNVPSKCRKMPFQRVRDPKLKIFGGGEHAPGPPYNCVVTRHYGLPLTKILATLLGLPCRNTDMSSLTILPCNLTISYSNLTINKNPKTKKVKNLTLSQVSSLLNAVISLSNSNTE